MFIHQRRIQYHKISMDIWLTSSLLNRQGDHRRHYLSWLPMMNWLSILIRKCCHHIWRPKRKMISVTPYCNSNGGISLLINQSDSRFPHEVIQNWVHYYMEPTSLHHEEWKSVLHYEDREASYFMYAIRKCITAYSLILFFCLACQRIYHFQVDSQTYL